MQATSDVSDITSSIELSLPQETSNNSETETEIAGVGRIGESAVASSSIDEVDEVKCPVTGVSHLNNDTVTSLVPPEREMVPPDTCKIDCGSSNPMPMCVSEDQTDDNSNDPVGPDEGDNASEISDFSDFSQESWQPVQGPIAWVQEQMRRGQSPRKILEDLVPSGTVIPDGLDPIMLWKIIINIVSEPPKRKKLHDINTLDDVLRLLKTCKKIMVLTGAGVSVSCGIPDFRSRDGVYARLAKDFPNLPDPQAMFDIHFFRSDPRPFFKFAKEIYPGQFQPSPCHHFIRLIEGKGKLLRNYTQNIDTLEQVAGIQKVVQCHGSFATATCAVCSHKVDSDAIKEDIFNQVIPHCPRCPSSNQNAVMKPDIVFFGESLPEHFHNQMAADKDECDLLIVIGSSLKVRPVALIPNSLPANVPQILINRERLHHFNFDVELLGNCDGIIGELCRRLGPGWEHLATPGAQLEEILMTDLPTPPVSPESVEAMSPTYPSDDSSNDAISQNRENAVDKADLDKLAPVVGSEAGPAIDTSEYVVSSACIPEKDLPQIIEPSECSATLAVAPEVREDDVGVYEVSTSQSESACAKSHRSHHHKHTGKWPFASINSKTYTECIPPSNAADQSCSACIDQPSASCSSQEIETLVSACHKRDVMYIPNKKTHIHHGQSHSHHNHHFHDISKSHQLAQPFEEPSSHQEHPTFVEPQTSLHLNGDIPQDQSDSTSLKKSEKRPFINTGAGEADTKDDEASSEAKRPKLSANSCDGDGPETDKKETPDSLSHDSSLDDMRKMWCSKHRLSLAHRMGDNQVLFLPPSRYVFKGAEVYTDSDSEDSSDDDDDGITESMTSSEVVAEEFERSSSIDSRSDSAEKYLAKESHLEGLVDSTAMKSMDVVGEIPSSTALKLLDLASVAADSSALKMLGAENVGCDSNEQDSGLPSLPLMDIEVSDLLPSSIPQNNECFTLPNIPHEVVAEALGTCPVSSSDEVLQ
ncbi:unnamed protein product [Lymnaea stagnalis]|uniref:protein acetyllysine N-acetyltransferase n=1 Tax=Lymnaea stagnalis TaxID=6523 RepID=A0AAV2IHE0_LYMST